MGTRHRSPYRLLSLVCAVLALLVLPAIALAQQAAPAATAPPGVIATALTALGPGLQVVLAALGGVTVLTLAVLAIQDKLSFKAAARRALRTFFQAATAALVTTFGGAAFASGEDWTSDALSKLLLSALIAGIVALVSLLHNLLEDAPGVPVPTIGKTAGT